jgi:hypothetical protein
VSVLSMPSPRRGPSEFATNITIVMAPSQVRDHNRVAHPIVPTA